MNGIHVLLLGIGAGVFNARDRLRDYPKRWRWVIVVFVIAFFIFIILIA